LIERTAEWLRTQQLDAPGADRLDRTLRAQAHAFEGNLLKQITDQLGDASCVALDALLGSWVLRPIVNGHFGGT